MVRDHTGRIDGQTVDAVVRKRGDDVERTAEVVICGCGRGGREGKREGGGEGKGGEGKGKGEGRGEPPPPLQISGYATVGNHND